MSKATREAGKVEEAKAKLVSLILTPSMGKNKAKVEKDVDFIVDVLMEK